MGVRRSVVMVAVSVVVVAAGCGVPTPEAVAERAVTRVTATCASNRGMALVERKLAEEYDDTPGRASEILGSCSSSTKELSISRTDGGAR